MENKKIKVLYIAGCSFSGSTLLSNILGQIDNFFSAGELRCIWEESLLKNYRCGCGVQFQECRIWEKILSKAFGENYQTIANEMIELHETRTDLPAMLLPWSSKYLESRFKKYLENLEKLYQAIKIITNSKVIIDSSKSPLYAYILDMLPNVELYILHLVRDPRAVHFSELKRKSRDPNQKWGNYKSKWGNYGAFGSSITWNVCNSVVENFWRSSSDQYLMLYYNDLIKEPKQNLEKILKFLKEDVISLPLVGKQSVELGSNHTVMGNENRFLSGLIELKLDESWKEEVKLINKFIVVVLTWPLFLRYTFFYKN